MNNMSTFTKWFLLNAIVLTAVFFAQTKGAITLMVSNDVSYLTIVIMSLYVVMSAFVGKLCYLADKVDGNTIKDLEERSKISKRAEIGWFSAEHFFSLGLLGTVFGLCVATATNLNAEAQVTDIVAGLKEGLHTAFYTTICGIVFSLPLQAQLMILKFKIDD
tara:strand:- start:581 stop:1066 length:486 start_codon:yes stop_codon:yes gene_type:complete